jgi:3-methyladenine DNA glycosylase/8-oxoguanine DNA glycosylase
VLERTFRPAHQVSLALTLAPLRRGPGDPCLRMGPDGVWRASRTPDGPATVHVTARAGEVRVRAWGPGAAWAVEAAPALVGADDDASGFEPSHPVLAGLARRMPGLRIPRSGAVTEALVPTVLEQKVTGIEAKRSYRALVRALGEPAPGPAGRTGLMVPPAPAVLASTPSYAFHIHGVERRRAETIRRVCAVAPRVEEVASMAPADAGRRLGALPGIGPWTVAEVALVALGDADAVSVNDYHLPHQVAWALAGQARADDDRMLELLEPYRGHRGRVIRLIVAAGIRAPRFGPRRRLRSIASI